jgi:hypothetical protein
MGGSQIQPTSLHAPASIYSPYCTIRSLPNEAARLSSAKLGSACNERLTPRARNLLDDGLLARILLHWADLTRRFQSDYLWTHGIQKLP